MKYLKIVNCPLNSCLIKKGNKIDWEGMGFNASDVSRLLVQGNSGGGYITLLPISNEEKFDSIKSIILDNINNNAFDNDSAEIVEQSTYDTDKELIISLRESEKEL